MSMSISIDNIAENMSVYIYGAGNRGIMTALYLIKIKGIIPRGLVVSDGHREGNDFRCIGGLRIHLYELNELIESNIDGVFLNTLVKDKDIVGAALASAFPAAECVCIDNDVKRYFDEYLMYISDSHDVYYYLLGHDDGLIISYLVEVRGLALTVVTSHAERGMMKYRTQNGSLLGIISPESFREIMSSPPPSRCGITLISNHDVTDLLADDGDADITHIPLAGIDDLELKYIESLPENAGKSRDELLIFDHIDVPLTTNCTLKCEHCAHLIQYYEKKPFIPIDDFCAEMDKILDTADFVRNIGLVGGEPFLYPHFKEFLCKLLDHPKVGHISISTNATIIPKDDVIALLCSPKVCLLVSMYVIDYQKLDQWERLSDRIYMRFKKYDENTDYHWRDMGPLKRRECTEQELREQYAACSANTFICLSYLNGRIFRCPRANHGYDLGAIPAPKGEYIDIANDSKEDMIAWLKNFRRFDYVQACAYCYGHTSLATPVPAGKQQTARLRIQ